MAVLLLNEAEVRSILTMEMALEAVDQGLRKFSLDEAQNVPRSRTQTDHAMLHVMSASAKTLGVMGFKAYATSSKGAHFLVGVFDGKSGELTALMQGDWLGQMRTGAASGVATRLLARPESTKVGLFGAGKQARTQLLAVCKVRTIQHVSVFSRSEDNRRAFCAEMSPACGCPVEPVARPEDAARAKDIVITATSSRSPVFQGDWLAEGTHLNVVGSNFLSKAEVDVATIRRAKVLVVDSREQGRIEAGDFHAAIEAGAMHWSDVSELGAVLVGRVPGRTHSNEITLFKSLGLAIEDVATAGRVVARAKELGVGRLIEW